MGTLPTQPGHHNLLISIDNLGDLFAHGPEPPGHLPPIGDLHSPRQASDLLLKGVAGLGCGVRPVLLLPNVLPVALAWPPNDQISAP